MSDGVIAANNLTKRYGDLTAVDNISLEVFKGEVFSILGPDGAGKTTFVEIMECLRKPTSGDVKVLGFDVLSHSKDIKRRVGILLPDFNTYDRLTVKENISDMDFFLPGVIGLTIMTTCTLYTQAVQSNYFATGIFRTLCTTPMTRIEWLISRALWQLVVVFISLAAMLIVGIYFFDAHLTLTWLSILIITMGGIMFTGLGMMISRFAKDEETANAAASAITFPMMFLAGSFFPLEQMPSYMQEIAKVLPLTYVNNGLRDTMVFGNTSGALFNLEVLVVLAAVFMIIGAYISKGTDD